MGNRRVSYGLLVEKLEGNGPPGKARHRLMDIINPLNAKLIPLCHLLALLGAHHILHVSRIRVKVHLKEGSSGMEWIDLYQVREKWQALVNAVMNLRYLTMRSFFPS